MTDTAPALRPGLPETTVRIAALPVDARGYPVPWFVAWLDPDGTPVPRGQGTPDFRVTFPGASQYAHRDRVCWVCGQPLGARKVFVVGPMCTVNRNSIEPPAHWDCADWSARACPFMTRPHMVRRDGAPGEATVGMLDRNPGVMALWVTRHYGIRAVDRNLGTIYFDIGEPERVEWRRAGLPATRAEVEESLASGLPALEEIAEKQGGLAVALLARKVEDARRFLPA